MQDEKEKKSEEEAKKGDELRQPENKLERRRNEKRQNKFVRMNMRQRIESVKKLRSESKALTGDLEGLRLVMERSQVGEKQDASRSILSKVE